MFFQAIATLLLFVGAAFVIWKFVIAPALKAKGIDIDAGDDVINEDTKKLERMQKQFEDMKASTEATDEMVELQKDIEYMKEKIARNKKDL